MRQIKVFNLFRSCLAFVALAAVFSSPLMAADLASAKAQGLVGEKADGFLGLVKSDAPADVQAMVEEINQKRKAIYEKAAEKTQADLDTVKKRAAQRAFQKTNSGHFIQGPDGTWVKK